MHKRLTSCASAFIVIAAAMVAGLGTPASADDISITASADAYVRSDLVDKNYGGTTTLYTDAADATD